MLQCTQSTRTSEKITHHINLNCPLTYYVENFIQKVETKRNSARLITLDTRQINFADIYDIYVFKDKT